MLKIFLLVCLFSLVACQGTSGGGSARSPKIVSGNVSTTDNGSTALINESLSAIAPSQRISDEDITSWQQEGLMTPEEAAELSQNI